MTRPFDMLEPRMCARALESREPCRSDGSSESCLPPARALPHFAPRGRRVIFLFMNGGPSHLDTFDPKPALADHEGEPPSEKLYRKGKTGGFMPSPFKFHKQGRSGIEMCDTLPNLARVIDDCCIIRSMRTDVPNHEPALLQMYTGNVQPVAAIDGVLGCCTARVRKTKICRAMSSCVPRPRSSSARRSGAIASCRRNIREPASSLPICAWRSSSPTFTTPIWITSSSANSLICWIASIRRTWRRAIGRCRTRWPDQGDGDGVSDAEARHADFRHQPRARGHC